MIAKASSCIGGTALANYVMSPEKGYELMRNGVAGNTATDLLQNMRIIQDLNKRATKKTFSLVLSPEIEDGKKVSDEALRSITHDFLEGLGIDPLEQQYIAFVHTEKEHKHIHIIANRVDFEGKLLSDHHIGKRAQWVAHRVALKHGLKSAKEIQIKNAKKRNQEQNNFKDLRKQIKAKHDWVLSQKPKTLADYIELMDKKGVTVVPVHHKYTGKLQGLRIIDKETGKSFKASEVHRSMSLNRLLATGISIDGEKQEGKTTKQTSHEVFSKEYTKAPEAQQQINTTNSIESLLDIPSSVNIAPTYETNPRRRRRKNKDNDKEIER